MRSAGGSSSRAGVTTSGRVAAWPPGSSARRRPAGASPAAGRPGRRRSPRRRSRPSTTRGSTQRSTCASARRPPPPPARPRPRPARRAATCTGTVAELPARRTTECRAAPGARRGRRPPASAATTSHRSSRGVDVERGQDRQQRSRSATWTCAALPVPELGRDAVGVGQLDQTALVRDAARARSGRGSARGPVRGRLRYLGLRGRRRGGSGTIGPSLTGACSTGGSGSTGGTRFFAAGRLRLRLLSHSGGPRGLGLEAVSRPPRHPARRRT